MKFPIREFPHRIRLDRAYLDRKRNDISCPICGRSDYLKVDFDPECYCSIYCNYRIVCTNCGHHQETWYDTVAAAVKALENI